ncbi:DUF4412 domain-containing protein [Geothrix sp. PMB-07]|uniref:DUF4412 domain-containing protein n=1 Tax=Geothrix sp. PMB-07 TaxID=3068640 RepID=UPI00274290DD|nr:DUF4412 domain-containing protein [Geothrix sp. PMB-07]WLT32119.1 DUF4412 domain-containing protein [Geothrix sp. PMB-07]
MRTLLATALALVFYSATLLAGDLSITMSGTGKGHEGEQTQYWSSKFMRTNHGASQIDSMVDFEKGVSYTINHKKKLIQQISWDDLEASLEAMADKMKDLPLFAQKMMGGGDNTVTAEPQGTETILGRTCKKWKITMGKMVLETSNDPSLKPPTPQGSYKRFLRLQNALGQMGPGASSALKVGEELAKVQGLALRTHTVLPIVGDFTTVATAIKEGPIPASTFDLPADYKVEDTGKKMRESMAKGR